MKNDFTLTIYSDDQLRLITKLSSMFLRKQVAILSLNMSLCEIEKMYRHTIVVHETLDHVVNLTAQIEKIIEVYKCYYNHNEELVYKQIVLFKIKTDRLMTDNMESLFRKNELKISEIQKEYSILQATGTENEMEYLIQKLNQIGLVEFIKSSRIALLKFGEGFDQEN